MECSIMLETWYHLLILNKNLDHAWRTWWLILSMYPREKKSSKGIEKDICMLRSYLDLILRCTKGKGGIIRFFCIIVLNVSLTAPTIIELS